MIVRLNLDITEIQNTVHHLSLKKKTSMFWRSDLLSYPCGIWKGKELPSWAHSKELASNRGVGSLLSLSYLKRDEDPLSETFVVLGFRRWTMSNILATDKTNNRTSHTPPFNIFYFLRLEPCSVWSTIGQHTPNGSKQHAELKTFLLFASHYRLKTTICVHTNSTSYTLLITHPLSDRPYYVAVHVQLHFTNPWCLYDLGFV